MKHIILPILLALCLTANAQAPAGRSATVTFFPEYKDAVITLANGKLNRQKQANIFMKKSTLVYKRPMSKDVMEAAMDVVKSVIMDGRTFMNVNNQLAEVIATDSIATLVRVRTIDTETMKNEYLNNSTITNSSLFDDLNSGRNIGENIGQTRLDGAEDDMPYPLLDTYYFINDKKVTLAHERSVKLVIKKDQRKEYQTAIAYDFSWTKPEDLAKLLKFFH